MISASARDSPKQATTFKDIRSKEIWHTSDIAGLLDGGRIGCRIDLSTESVVRRCKNSQRSETRLLSGCETQDKRRTRVVAQNLKTSIVSSSSSKNCMAHTWVTTFGFEEIVVSKDAKWLGSKSSRKLSRLSKKTAQGLDGREEMCSKIARKQADESG